MHRARTKHTAEAVLRELPSVVGACVREDINGNPREVHLLVRGVSGVRELAHDVRDLLEERLGIAIDQRIISIAQLTEQNGGPRWLTPDEPGQPSRETEAMAAPERSVEREVAVERELVVERESSVEREPSVEPSVEREVPVELPRPSTASADNSTTGRLIYDGLETRAQNARVSVRVRLSWRGTEFVGESVELDAGQGRARAAAAATTKAANAACGAGMKLELEGASISRALERDYAVVSVLAISPRLGRRPLALVGAQPIEGDIATAAALAVLKASNRLIERTLSEAENKPGAAD